AVQEAGGRPTARNAAVTYILAAWTKREDWPDICSSCAGGWRAANSSECRCNLYLGSLAYRLSTVHTWLSDTRQNERTGQTSAVAVQEAGGRPTARNAAVIYILAAWVHLFTVSIPSLYCPHYGCLIPDKTRGLARHLQ
ncbi:hypothetical protein J6590_007565, partial [Homalodisca vitripennis]